MMNGKVDYFDEAVRLQQAQTISFSAPKTVEAMAAAFAEHCQDGGSGFIEYLRPWHMVDALEAINDAANGAYTPEVALAQIREALGELIAIAVIGHREAIEWEGVE